MIAYVRIFLVREQETQARCYRDYFSCKNPPLDIYDESYWDIPVLELFSPMPLHLKIGAANDCLEIMEDLFPREMKQFYEDNKFEKGDSAGKKFLGVTLSEIMSEEKLAILSLMLDRPGDVFIDYLAALRELLVECNKEEVSEEEIYMGKVESYRQAFEAMHSAYGLSETIKVVELTTCPTVLFLYLF